MLEVDAQRARTEETHGPSTFENGEQLFFSCQRSLFFVAGVGFGRSVRNDHDIAAGICAGGASGHSVDIVERVVHDLAIG